MYALQPRRTGKSLSRGKEARMTAMQAVEHPEGEHRSSTTLPLRYRQC